MTPRDKLLGLDAEIWAERDRKLEAAREARRQRRELAADPTFEYPPSIPHVMP